MVLTYDSDGAGVKAALRAIPILKSVGMSVRVLNMRPYKDPDEFIKNLGPEAFRQRIAEARNSFLFEIDTIRQQIFSMEDPEEKTRPFTTRRPESFWNFPRPWSVITTFRQWQESILLIMKT